MVSEFTPTGLRERIVAFVLRWTLRLLLKPVFSACGAAAKGRRCAVQACSTCTAAPIASDRAPPTGR